MPLPPEILYKRIQELHDKQDEIYRERNQCISLICRLAMALGLNVGIGEHINTDRVMDSKFLNVVYVDLPSGQCGWHIPEHDMPMFEFLPKYQLKWDGHTTEQKYERVMEPKVPATLSETLDWLLKNRLLF